MSWETDVILIQVPAVVSWQFLWGSIQTPMFPPFQLENKNLFGKATQTIFFFHFKLTFVSILHESFQIVHRQIFKKKRVT